MISSNSFLELNFFCNSQKLIKKFHLSFDGIIRVIKSEVYRFNLPDNLFNNGKDKSLVSITLYSEEQSQDYSFYINKGENRAYVGQDYLFWSVYQIIIYSQEKYIISQLGKNFDKFDSLGNKYRSRITLINTEPRFLLNGESLDFNKIVHFNYDDNSESQNEFYQISFQIENDIKDNKMKKQFIVKKIQEDEEIDDIKYILDNKKNLNDFWTKLEKDLKDKNVIMSYENLKYKYDDIFKMKIPYIKENNQYINNDSIDDLNACFITLFVTIVLRKFSILKDEDYLKEVFNKAKDDFEFIRIKTNINNEEKLKILATYLLLYSDCEDASELDSIRINHFIFAEKENNSIMDKVYQFYQAFFNLLTEDSNIFFYLLQLNSGIGYSHKQKVCCDIFVF